MDSSLYVKRAAITALKAAAPLAGVPAGRVYPMQRPAEPVWPFVAYGAPITEPFGATCLDGSQTTVAIHAFAKTTPTQGGEDAAHEIASAIGAVLDGAAIALESPYPATAHFTFTGSQVMQDSADANSFHSFATFRVTVSS